MSIKLIQRGVIASLMSMLFACIGCGPGLPPTAPVKGKVLLNGQPLTTGRVITVPEAGRGANGIIQPDGSFELSTYGDRDGAAIGKNKVGIVAYEDTGRHGPEAGYGRLLVPERYANPETSQLTINVKVDQENVVELNLTTKSR